MLTRIAEGLYWMGRYIKRSEHLARYLRVQYFSIIEGHAFHTRDFTLRSIMNMAGVESRPNEQIDEEGVLLGVGFDLNNPSSIFSTIRNARENARNLRHVFSNELWESINKYYLFVQNYPIDRYKTRSLYDFTTKLEEYVKVIQSNIYTTLIKNDEYYFILLGMHLENAIQVNRILRSKIIDTEILSKNGELTAIRQYQWITTLKALESLDMHNQVYRHQITVCSLSEFLITNPDFPRSFYFNLQNLLDALNAISIVPDGFKQLEYHIAKLVSKVRFYECEDMTHLSEFLTYVTKNLDAIHHLCEEVYFNKQTSEV